MGNKKLLIGAALKLKAVDARYERGSLVLNVHIKLELKMRYKAAALAVALFGLLSSGSSQASTLNYDLVLSSGTSQIDGTFSVDGSVPNSGQSGPLQITSLSLDVGGTPYSFTSLFFTPVATFNNGGLTSIEYLGDADGFKLDLGTLGLNYAFTDFLNPSYSSLGTVSASAVGVSTTPLPSGLPLFITGLVALALLGWRKKRMMQIA